MASEYTLPAEVLSDIAGAIRSKAGLTGPIKPVDMAAAINSIPSGGGFGPEDEGKVVSGGALVAQTAHATVTQNGTYDTTLNNSVTVSVAPSGKKYASGTYTLAAASTAMSFDPDLDFTPTIFVIKPTFTPNYAANGCIGASYVGGLTELLLGGYNSNTATFVYSCFETRTTYSTYASVQSNNSNAQYGLPSFSANAINAPCRHGNYPWAAGTYSWGAYE